MNIMPPIPKVNHITMNRLEMQQETKSSTMSIEIYPSDEVIVKLDPDKLHYLIFPTPNHQDIFKVGNTVEDKRRNQTAYDQAYLPLLIFFNELNVEEATKVARYFIEVHETIEEFSNRYQGNDDKILIADAKSLIKYLSEKTLRLDTDINIYGKFRNLVLTQVPIVLYDVVGRITTTKKITFSKEQLADCTMMALYCKFLVPVYGLFLDRFKNKIQNFLRDILCASILEDVFEYRFPGLDDKIRDFMYRKIDGSEKSDINSTAKKRKKNAMNELAFAVKGCTFSVITEQNMSSLYTKQFPMINLYQEEEEGIMSVINRCAKLTENNSPIAPSSNRGVKNLEEIENPEDRLGDEGNTTFFEMESINSSSTADTPMVITFAARHLVKQETDRALTAWYLKENVENLREIESVLVEATDYYKRMMVEVSPVGRFLMGLFFGRELGGGEGIPHLSLEAEASLLILTQMRILYYSKSDVPFDKHQIVHWCTAAVDDVNIKKHATATDNLIRLGWKNSQYYKLIMGLNPYKMTALEWDRPFREPIINLGNNNYVNNTAPALCKYMKEDPISTKKPFMYNESIAHEFMEVIYTAIEDNRTSQLLKENTGNDS